MSTVAERLTADAYLARADPRRTELIDGAVVVNEPSVLHQHVCGLVYRALAAWTETADGRGMAPLPLNVALDAGNVLAPDVLWFDGELALGGVNAHIIPFTGTRRACRIWSSRSARRAPGATMSAASASSTSATACSSSGWRTR
jgi:hypothetical protein